MNKNYKTYLLLIAVIFVFGLLGYRILSALNHAEETNTQKDIDISFTPIQTKPKDRFSISDVSRDPFLGKFSNSSKKDKSTKSITKKDKPHSNIIYNGTITSTSAEQIFIIRIENAEYLLKKGDVVGGVKLVSGNSKQIKIKIDNTYKIVKR